MMATPDLCDTGPRGQGELPPENSTPGSQGRQQHHPLDRVPEGFTSWAHHSCWV